ncbi:sulfonate transport system ATP-binding protein [Murinocardiopsis flavida]|uniref:Sulfonate transport system ATP-binding protein n=1 Tax=Murinocardiopsis flavida TaxID=645275 RepID=A0A2P8CXK8_9ACTN|nr:ABC transporter ATP-binding protein [Murinocardiopsis flavida]PSK89646.1 sulfonate transport system ATP-binding protein [Murinocardiopsis flavida]
MAARFRHPVNGAAAARPAAVDGTADQSAALDGGASRATAVDATADRPAAPEAAASGGAAAEVRGLSRAFDGRPVLADVDLRIESGEFVALLGRSGSGKSTLLRVLAGLDREAEGTVAASDSAMVAFQEPRLLPWKRVWANIALGLDGTAPKEAAVAALGEVGLADHADAWPLTLSGGEAQRASLARALVREPELLLLDEPFGALDALTRITMHDLVLHLWRRHLPGVLLVTHDVDEALLLADRVLVLADGRIAHEEHIGLPRPRHRDADALLHARDRLLAVLGVHPTGDR